jgi:hypothetical protein
MIPFLWRLAVFTTGLAVVMPRVVDAFVTDSVHRDIWQMAGAGVYVVLFSIGCKHVSAAVSGWHLLTSAIYVWREPNNAALSGLQLAKDKP